MNSDGRVKGIGLLVPDAKPLRNKSVFREVQEARYKERHEPPEPRTPEPCVHHWLIGPPTYSHDGLIEDTDWECKKCGEKRHNALLCPFQEVQDEWVENTTVFYSSPRKQ
jgi:hypothetical protein